ncbi:MAG: TIGR03560 family F420-dependent LLM class oxidoreductase [Deltaproteobacteria bacterium]|nr:MAG: TIGR03560 family F420-dependent LLM class oxidoreductase [Deltaproteobacteria bacterium]
MEFGTLVPQGWRLDLAAVADPREKWETVRRVSKGLDEAGWDSLWVYDHFHTFPQKRVEATFEAWMMMSALAEITERARIGQFVTCVQYREPSYLAKIAACVDVASGGRLNVGVGSGWYAEEFEAYGYDFRTVGTRLARLREALDVMRAMWSEPMASYEGKHYRIVEAVCEPKPLQKPRPPIWIGGRGRKVLLRLVAEYADVWNYNGPIEEFDETVEVLKGHCRDVGRDFDEIRLTAMSGGICYRNDDELDEYFERIAGQDVPRDLVFEHTRCKGTPEQCIEYLNEWKKKGCDGIVFFFQDIATFGDGRSQPEIFKREVLPHV